jgi:hypothetical protein
MENFELFEEFDSISDEKIDERMENHSFEHDSMREATRLGIELEPRFCHILSDIVEPRLEGEVDYIGSDPSEIDISVMGDDKFMDTFIDELSKYAWLTMSDVLRGLSSVGRQQLLVFREWDSEKTVEYFNSNDVYQEDITEEGLEDVFNSIEITLSIMESDDLLFDEPLEIGDSVIVNAPPVTVAGNPNCEKLSLENEQDVADAYDRKDISRDSYVSQRATVTGFQSWESVEDNAFFHPQLVVSLDEGDKTEWVLTPDYLVEASGLGLQSNLDKLQDRSGQMYPSGWAPSVSETWIVRVPDSHERFFLREDESYDVRPYLTELAYFAPGDVSYSTEFRAEVIQRVQTGGILDKSQGYTIVELETGEMIALPPKAFHTELPEV